MYVRIVADGRRYNFLTNFELINACTSWYVCRWSLIAGRIPGRTDNEIKNYWNAHLCKKSQPQNSKVAAKNMKPSVDGANVEGDHSHDSKVESECSDESLLSSEEEYSSDLLMDFYTREMSLSEFLDTDFTKFSSLSTSKALMVQGEEEQIQTQPYNSPTQTQGQAEDHDESPMRMIISQEMMNNLISEDQSDSDFGYQLSAAFTDCADEEEEYWII